MIVFIFNLVLLAVSSLLNVITRLIFTAAAQLIVLAIQAFKVPGQAIQGGLEQLGNVIRACLEYLLELVIEAMNTIISSLFDALKEGISGSAAAAGSALGRLMENTRESVGGLIKDLAPKVIEGFAELITTVAADLWKNYKDAIGYIIKNV